MDFLVEYTAMFANEPIEHCRRTALVAVSENIEAWWRLRWDFSVRMTRWRRLEAS